MKQRCQDLLQNDLFVDLLKRDIHELMMSDEKDIDCIRFIDSVGGTLRSSADPTVTCTIPEGALQDEFNFIPLSIQVINVDKDLVQESLGKGSAISPVVIVEPLLRKFRKDPELSLPIPGYDDKNFDSNNLRILLSLSPSDGDIVEFEDITGITPYTVINTDMIQFTISCNGRVVIVNSSNSAIDVRNTMNDLYAKTLADGCTNESGPVNQMFQAAKSGDTSVLLEAINSGDADINHHNQEGQTVLHISCQEGHIHVVNELIKRDANCALLSKKGNTPIHLACYYNHKDVVETLLDNGVDVNMKSKGGYPPLYAAILGSHCDIVQLLMSRSADTTWVSPDGLSPILVALFSKVRTMTTSKGMLFATVELLKDSLDHTLTCSSQLIQRGFKNHGEALLKCVQIRTSTIMGHTILESIRKKLASLSSKALKEDIASLENTSDELKDCSNFVMENDTERFEDLLSKGFDINSMTERSVTILHIACLHGQQEIVEMILNHFKNNINAVGSSQELQRLGRSLYVNKQTQSGFTSLYLAAQEGHKEIVFSLLFNGASGKIINEFGLSPSDIAIEMGHQDLATLIRNTQMSSHVYESRTAGCAIPAVHVNKRKFSASVVHYKAAKKSAFCTLL